MSDNKKRPEDDDVQGHGRVHPPSATEDDDVQGHGRGHPPSSTEDDDV